MAIYFFQGKEDYLMTHHVDGDDDRKIEIIRNRILEFFNMKNVHFLFGSGTSCPAIPNMNGLFERMEEEIKKKSNNITEENKNLFKNIADIKGKNLEEILGVLYSKREFLKGTEPKDSEKYIECNDLIHFIEKIIFNEINISFTDKVSLNTDNVNTVLDTYKNFYQKIALRNKDLSRINIFTTNNDLFNEQALDALNIHYINGFNGGLNKYFNPAMFNYTYSKRMDTSIDRFEPIENMVYLYKIHGSINWTEEPNNNTYFDVKEEYSPTYDEKKSVLIYPTPMKQNKSLGSPYSDLFREFQHKLLEPNGVLFVIGYSFSDEHVNDIIYRALATNSTFNLVIINNIDEEKQICKVNDNRVFRIWEEKKKDDGIVENSNEKENENKEPLHYFDRIVDELLPNLDAFKQKDILAEFVKQIKVEK
jgi:hypothetical protein